MAKRVRAGGRPPSKRGAPVRRPGSSGPVVRRGPDLVVNPTPSAAAEPIEPVDDTPAAGPDDLPRASGGHLTEAELRKAEELEAQIAAQERAAMAEQIRRRTRARAAESPDLGDVNAPLRVRAAREYAYVARDVRRIVFTGAIMVAILAVLAILVNVVGVISL
ncbi:MAG TPA: hypothetical protein VFW20_09045 [Candidatus Limnocylindrales bacterium]|nr:hypothetical protein [Candidatus Limnocylindrales bacterium]